MGQRNLLHNETQTLRSSVGAIQASLRSDQIAGVATGQPGITNPLPLNYAEENDNQQHDGEDCALIVNTTSLGLESPWMQKHLI